LAKAVAAIDGTPTVRGTFPLNLIVRDQVGRQATQVTGLRIH
jgi:hypothetical protein